MDSPTYEETIQSDTSHLAEDVKVVKGLKELFPAGLLWKLTDTKENFDS